MEESKGRKERKEMVLGKEIKWLPYKQITKKYFLESKERKAQLLLYPNLLTLSYSIISYPALSYPSPFCPVLLQSTLFFPAASYLVPYCPISLSFILLYSILFRFISEILSSEMKWRTLRVSEVEWNISWFHITEKLRKASFRNLNLRLSITTRFDVSKKTQLKIRFTLSFIEKQSK